MKNKKAKSIFSSLDNYSSMPPPDLWEKIEAQLDQPKKKRRAIIWWSIAASLIVGLSVPAVLYFSSNQGDFIGNGDINSYENRSVGNNEKDNEIINANDINSIKEQKNNNKLNNVPIFINNSKSVVTVTPAAISSQNDSNAKKHSGFKNLNLRKNNLNAAIVKEETKSDQSAVNQNSNSTISKSVLASENSVYAANSVTHNKTVVSAENTNNPALNSNKKNTGNASPKDSLNKIKLEVAALESAVAQLDKEKNKKKNETVNVDKWALQVFAGVMSSQNYSNEKVLGNTIDSKQSSGYGVKASYKLNKKWGVRSGFKINELGQKIADVSYYEQQSFSGIMSGTLPLANDSFKSNSSQNMHQIVFVSSNPNYMFALDSKSDNGFEKGNVTQNLKYFEMPLEVSYALLNKKKANIVMNTGGFVGKLIANELLLNGNSIGENNNVNEYVFGTLLSSTLQYEIYKKTKFFIEPGMNYYINPMENQSFNEFQWMFNVGLNVTF
jgi:hypothetical protein